MGRPSRLSPPQWDEIKRRLVAGETMRSLAKEFKVGVSTISKQCSPKTERIRSVANKLVEASQALSTLPVPEQTLALRLADDLKAVTRNLTRAAKAGSDTAAQLAELANGKVKNVILESGRVDQMTLMDVSSLTVASNRAATPALRLVAASQGRDDGEGENELDGDALSTLRSRLLGG